MKRVYIAENLADAQLLRNRMEAVGIKAHVFNEFAHGAVGELPFTHTWPEVWVERDDDLERADPVLEAHGRTRDSDGVTSCAACGETNPSNFEICWSCGSGL